MLAGTTFGPFAIEHELGSGAMGTVYKATLQKGDRAIPVALKVVSLALIGNESAVARFEREANILQQLRHPHIVRYVGSGTHKPSKTKFIAMEFVDGRPLDKILADRGRIGWEDVAQWGQQLCGALQHAHDKGIIHRDLKPSNLMITADGQLKLADFGIAKDTDVTALTGANSTIGTAAYMSPEQCKGARDLTGKSDLYSLGVVLYELVTGKKPFYADTTIDMFMKHVNETPVRPRRLVPDLPVWLDNLILFLLEKDKDHRPLDAATVGKLLADVEEKVKNQQSVGAEVANARRVDRPVGDAPLSDADREAARSLKAGGKKKKKKPAGPWYARPATKAAALGVALLAVVGAGGYLFWQQVKPEGLDAAFARFEATAPNTDGRLATATAFLRSHGSAPDPRVETVRSAYQDEKARWAEGILQKWAGKTKGRPDVFDEDAFRAAQTATDAEKRGDLKEAAELWAAVRARYPTPDPAKLLDDDEVRRAALTWVADKRERLARADVPAAEARLRDKIDKARLFETDLPNDTATPEGAAVRALRLEQFPDPVKARAAWDALAGRTEADPADRLWFLLAASHAARLAPEAKKVEDPPADRLARLTAKIEALEAKAPAALADPEDRVGRRDVRNGCREIAALYDDDPTDAVQAAVARAKKLGEAVAKK